MTDTIVKISQLSRQFDQQIALDNVNLEVRKGQVYGIVGENGAGKTTLIKHILGMYRAQKGTVKVFSMDPVQYPEKVLAHIGYLSEEPELPAWMTIEQLLNYQGAFYSGWDQAYALELIEQFQLDISKKVKELSKGQKARTGLCLAQAYRPDLLLLDEPSSGLDPNVRNDILEEIINTISDEGRSVIFSSHLLEEVERVSDHLLMLSHGKVMISDELENVLSGHFVVHVSKRENLTRNHLLTIEGIISVESLQNEWRLCLKTDASNLSKSLQQLNIEAIHQRSMSITEIFTALSHSQPEQEAQV